MGNTEFMWGEKVGRDLNGKIKTQLTGSIVDLASEINTITIGAGASLQIVNAKKIIGVYKIRGAFRWKSGAPITPIGKKEVLKVLRG